MSTISAEQLDRQFLLYAWRVAVSSRVRAAVRDAADTGALLMSASCALELSSRMSQQAMAVREAAQSFAAPSSTNTAAGSRRRFPVAPKREIMDDCVTAVAEFARVSTAVPLFAPRPPTPAAASASDAQGSDSDDGEWVGSPSLFARRLPHASSMRGSRSSFASSESPILGRSASIFGGWSSAAHDDPEAAPLRRLVEGYWQLSGGGCLVAALQLQALWFASAAVDLLDTKQRQRAAVALPDAVFRIALLLQQLDVAALWQEDCNAVDDALMRQKNVLQRRRSSAIFSDKPSHSPRIRQSSGQQQAVAHFASELSAQLPTLGRAFTEDLLQVLQEDEPTVLRTRIAEWIAALRRRAVDAMLVAAELAIAQPRSASGLSSGCCALIQAILSAISFISTHDVIPSQFRVEAMVEHLRSDPRTLAAFDSAPAPRPGPDAHFTMSRTFCRSAATRRFCPWIGAWGASESKADARGELDAAPLVVQIMRCLQLPDRAAAPSVAHPPSLFAREPHEGWEPAPPSGRACTNVRQKISSGYAPAPAAAAAVASRLSEFRHMMSLRPPDASGHAPHDQLVFLIHAAERVAVAALQSAGRGFSMRAMFARSRSMGGQGHRDNDAASRTTQAHCAPPRWHTRAAIVIQRSTRLLLASRALETRKAGVEEMLRRVSAAIDLQRVVRAFLARQQRARRRRQVHLLTSALLPLHDAAQLLRSAIISDENAARKRLLTAFEQRRAGCEGRRAAAALFHELQQRKTAVVVEESAARAAILEEQNTAWCHATDLA